MMYFIPWAILLALLILAVPIAFWLDSRKMRSAYGDANDYLEDDEVNFEDEGGEAVADEEDGFGGENDFGGEELSEFEEVN